MQNDSLQLWTHLPIKAINAGLFISRGIGKHPERVMDSYEVIFVRSGILGISEEDIAYEVHEGQALILYPHRQHGGTKTYLSDLSFYWIHFHLNENTNFAETHTIQLPKLTQLHKPDQLIELLRFFLEHQENGSRSQISLDLLLLNILNEIADSQTVIQSSSQSCVLANLADGFIRTHFHEALTTVKIAQMLTCNPDYLGRIYHRVFGKTLTDAIHEYRLKYAAQLLLDSTCNINEVARRSGYDDSGYFRRLFKRQKGISPSTYRRTYSLVHLNTQ
jgi:YesN/AraC family two-component response regulator